MGGRSGRKWAGAAGRVRDPCPLGCVAFPSNKDSCFKQKAERAEATGSPDRPGLLTRTSELVHVQYLARAKGWRVRHRPAWGVGWRPAAWPRATNTRLNIISRLRNPQTHGQFSAFCRSSDRRSVPNVVPRRRCWTPETVALRPSLAWGGLL